MSEKRTLANIAKTAYWDTESENKNTFDRVAKAVEKEVLERFKNDEEEPVAGQELTFVQAAQLVAKYGSTDGLQWFDTAKTAKKEWKKDGYSKGISICFKYRVAPKKVNDPDDPTTWEKGVAMFRRDGEDDVWVLDVFIRYSNGGFYKYGSDNGVYKYAKLATHEQIEAWKLINEDL